jgi:hypothetical protein
LENFIKVKNNNFDLSILNTKQIDKINAIDIHSVLLQEDVTNIPSIIQKLSSEKLLALIDISSWEKDVFDTNNFAMWLKIILSLNPYEALKELKRLDQRQVVMFLSQNLIIDWYDPEYEYQDESFITDDKAFILFARNGNLKDEKNLISLDILKLAYIEGIAYGRRLCVDAINLIYSSEEEEAYRIKNSRLSDEGIPTYIEALELFHFEKPTSLLKTIVSKAKNKKSKKLSPESDFISSIFTVVSKDYWKNFINLDDEIIKDLQIELSALLTSSLVINNAVDKNEKYIKGIIERSKSYLLLGLELIKENSDLSLNDVLKYVKLRHIFRLGFSLLIDLKQNASNIKALKENIEIKDMLSFEEDEFIEKLLITIPMYKEVDKKAREFKSLSDVKNARKILSDIAKKLMS